MKKIYKRFWYLLCLFLMVLACTKDVGLITEVEFELFEEHTAEGFINQGLPTTFTIVPEEELEGYEYGISYEVLQGAGYFEDVEGNRLESGKGLPMSPLTTSLLYLGTEVGEHRLKIVGSDNFGMSEEIEILYNLKNVPARWEATSTVTEIELGKSAGVSLLFELVNTTLDVSYESRFEFANGTGTFVPAAGNLYDIDNGYSAITPGVYDYDFTPGAAGEHHIVFVLRDSNGQELKTDIVFNVVEFIEVIAIDLGEHDEIDMEVGDELECPATFTPSNATDQGVTLVSSDPDVVLIDENNVCIALAVGTATVTVTSTSNPDATDSVLITVTEPDRIPVTAITLSQEDPSADGAIRQLIATVLPTNATDPSVIWSSGDTNLATIDQNGLLTGLTSGSVTIKAASVSDPDIAGLITVEITGGPLQDGADIISFALPVQNNVDIDTANHTITVNVLEGTDLNVAPQTLTISQGATVSPGISAIQDFNAAVTYTVTAENEDVQLWTVNVTVSPLTGSAENDITEFILPEQISSSIDTNTHTVAITMADGADLSVIPQSILVSQGASITPDPGLIAFFNGPVEYTVTAENGDEQIWTVNTTVLPPTESDAKDITAFTLPGQNSSVIDVANFTVLVNVPDGTELNVAPELFTISGTGVSPAFDAVLDFNAQVTYLITAENGSTQEWTINVTVSPPTGNGANDITAFEIPGQLGSSNIDTTNKTVVISLANETPVNVAPTVLSISQGATVVPSINAIQDFSGPVEYTVTAQNGDEQLWTINTTILPPTGSGANDITAFAIAGQNSSSIDVANKIIAVNVPDGTNLNVAPQALAVSPGATISPAVDAIQDFNSQVVYTVTAENGSQQEWTVNVTVSPPTGSGANDITAFELPVQNSTDIDNVNYIITVNVPDGTNLNVAPSTLNVSPNATFTPTIASVQDFNAAVRYTVRAENGNEQIWTVNVTVAPNQPPVAVDDVAGVELGQTVTINVIDNDSDPDTPNSELVISGFIGVQPANAGSFDVQGQQMVFTSSGNYTGDATFGYTITDGNDGNEDSAIVTVTIEATASSTKTIDSFEIDNVPGTINGTDITLELPSGTDLTSLSPVILITGQSVSPASGAVTNFTNDVVYTVTADDNSTIDYFVMVTLAPPTNTDPVANDDDFSVSESGTLNTSVIANDTDADPLDNLTVDRVNNNAGNVGSVVNGTNGGLFTISPGGNLTFDPNGDFDLLNNGQSDTTTVIYRITDGNNGFSTATVTVTITGIDDVNVSPVADAGPDQGITLPTNSVTLDGSGSSDTPPGTIVSYQWTQISASPVADILNPNNQSTTVNTLTAGTYVFRLTVTDDLGLTDTDDITVVVNPLANDAPTANAGNDENITLPANSVTLDGSGSTDDGLIVSWEWTQISISPVADILNPNNQSTTANTLTPGTYVFRLTVTDDLGLTDTDDITVVVNAANNIAPTAVISSNVVNGTTPLEVNFTGDQSTDSDGSVVSHLWNFGENGQTSTLENPTYTYINPGTFTVTLIVTDDDGATDTETLNISVTAPNQAPNAVGSASPLTGSAPLTVNFKNSNSTDSDGNIVSTVYEFGDGTINNNGGWPYAVSHEYTTAGTYTARMTVTDNDGASDFVEFTIVVETAEPRAVFDGITNINRPPNSEESGTLTITGGEVIFEVSTVLTALQTGEGEIYVSFEIVGEGIWNVFSFNLNVPNTMDTDPIGIGTYNYILKFESGSIGSGNASVRAK